MVVEVPEKGWGPCWRALSLFSGQPSADLKMERPASPFLIAEAVDVDDEGAGGGCGRLMGERGARGDEGGGEEGCGERCAAGEGEFHGELLRVIQVMAGGGGGRTLP